jgi:tRNA pseudouridine38-40 synthase
LKLAGLVEYEGAEFAGWAAQPGMRTVEGELAEGLQTVLRHPVKLSVAGRTDAGVHASGQIVSFETDVELDPRVVAYKATAVLPKDLALRRCVGADEAFDARRDARSRSYEYRIVNDPVRSPLRRRGATYVASELDFGLLQQAAGLVLGTHDFRAFTPAKTYHVRFERVVTESAWERSGDLLAYRVTADSFLYGMVRTLVGTMLEVANGGREMASFEELLSGGERSEAGQAVPSKGLTLVGVGYENLDIGGGADLTETENPSALLARIDDYVEERFAPQDEALEAAVRESRSAGLPEIQVSPSEARLLQLLTEMVGARRVLEVGTLGGYSTIHFGRALPEDGFLISLELDERHAEVARKNIERARLSDKVEIRVGDARELLRKLDERGEGPFDLVFIDADKEGYPVYLKWALRLARPGSLILGDNTLWGGSILDPQDDSARAVNEFNEKIAEDPRLSAIVLPLIREHIDGLTIARVRDRRSDR